MGPNEMTNKTNPRLEQILKRYVGAESVGADNTEEPIAANSTDWYNMTCPRCPWFIDGAKTGQYVQVSCDAPGDAPDNAPVAGNDADGDSGRTTSDSGRATGDDTPWDEEWDELLDGVDASIDADEEANWVDTDGVGADGRRRVPFVQCIRPESVECLNKSICVQLIVAGDLIRQQAAVQKMRGEMMGGPAPFVVGTEENRRRVVADARRKHNRPGRRDDRSRILIKAARKRGR